jgi:hypothetical protein
MKAAPDGLRLRVQNALLKDSRLRRKTIAFDAGWALKGQQDSRQRKWRWEVAVAIKQIGTLIRLIEESTTKAGLL